MLDLITWLNKNKAAVASVSVIIWIAFGRYVLDMYALLGKASNGFITLEPRMIENLMITIVVIVLTVVATSAALLLDVKFNRKS